MFEQLIQGYYTIDIGKIKVKNMAGGLQHVHRPLCNPYKECTCLCGFFGQELRPALKMAVWLSTRGYPVIRAWFC